MVLGSYKQIIDAIIYYSTKEKMAVILDLHRLVHTIDGPEMANADSKRFWAEVATEYKDFGTVLFELFNEPHDIDQNTWLKGNQDCAGYQQLYDAVRGTGAKNICLVSGLDWAYDLSFVNDNFRVAGDNIIYCSHPYYPKGNTEGKFSPASNFAGVLGKFPVIFTEFGCNSPDQYSQDGVIKLFALDYYDQVISYMDTNGFHYTGWAWWVDNNQPWWPTLINDWKTGYPWNGGEHVHKDIRLHPGTPIDSS
jgi:aryl-phospho-beta-D-glucosidase BglC (GH1 family)